MHNIIHMLVANSRTFLGHFDTFIFWSQLKISRTHKRVSCQRKFHLMTQVSHQHFSFDQRRRITRHVVIEISLKQSIGFILSSEALLLLALAHFKVGASRIIIVFTHLIASNLIWRLLESLSPVDKVFFTFIRLDTMLLLIFSEDESSFTGLALGNGVVAL